MTSLDEGVDDEQWRLWCRLCAQQNADDNVNIFCKDEQGALDTAMAKTISKYLCVNITPDDELPRVLCRECNSRVTTLSDFAQRTEKVQQMFDHIRTAGVAKKLNWIDLRRQYGLDEGIAKDFPQTEVLYVDMKIDQPLRNRLRGRRPKASQQTELPEVLCEELFDTQMEDVCAEEDVITKCNAQDEDKEESLSSEDENGSKEEDSSDCKPPEPDSDDSDGNAQGSGDESGWSDCLMAKTTHKRRKSTKNPYFACAICSRSFVVKKSVKRHLLKKHKDVEESKWGENIVKLENEEYKKQNKKNLESCRFACSLCKHRFIVRKSVKRHILKKHPNTEATILEDKVEKPMSTCPTCKLQFVHKYQLNKHMIQHLPEEERKTVVCSYCNKQLPTERMLRGHIKHSHANKNICICEECGKVLRSRSELKAHLSMHSDVEPYECDVCNKRFKLKRRLKVHMHTHDATKHICNVCGQKLNSRFTLFRHSLVHSKDKPHKCDFCEKSFRCARDLKVHLILHSGLRPYACDFCDKRFANGPNCRNHKKAMHPEELAAQEAAGIRAYTKNVPKLEVLKAIARASNDLVPVRNKDEKTQTKTSTQEVSDNISPKELHSQTSETAIALQYSKIFNSNESMQFLLQKNNT